MICVECKTPAACLYYRYKSDYIKLAICSACNKIVDKYIEYDNVLLFIDLLLMKPQAYRHLAYNVTETHLLQDARASPDYVEDSGAARGVKYYIWEFNSQFSHLLRFIGMIILFEVYLTWSEVERDPQRSLVMSITLQRPILVQYLLFILKAVMDHGFFNLAIQLAFHFALGWGATNKNISRQFQTRYNSVVLLTTVLVSNSIKLFPILMLIWPYDRTFESSRIVSVIAVLSVIEALKITTGYGYSTLIPVYFLCRVVQLVLCRVLFYALISYLSGYSVAHFLQEDYHTLKSSIHSLAEFAN